MIDRNLVLYACRQAKLAYGSTPKGTVALDDGQSRPRGFINPGKNAAVIAFAGTESILDWLTDFMALHVSWYDFRVHNGFYREFYKLMPQVMEVVKQYSRGSDILVTGHSMGAALASMTSYYLAREYDLPTTCITFESPRVGDRGWAKSFNKYVPRSIRIQHDEDLVCRVPKIGYRHVDRLVRINDQGKIIRFAGIIGLFEYLFNVSRADLNFSVIDDHPIGNVLSAVELFAEKGGEA
jgi:hypothetical protein